MLPVSVKVGASNLAEWGRQAANRINDLIGKLSGYLPLTGGTLTGDLSVPDEAYGVAWNASTEVPTKNALYDKIETLGGGGGTTTNPLTMNNGGAGAASGTTFDGSVARTISYNTVGAAASSHTHAQSDIAGLTTADSPQFTAINLGHASDTTLARTGAGDIAIEGNAVYRAGGTDVPVTDGGTGSSTAAGARANLGVNKLLIVMEIDGGGAVITNGYTDFTEGSPGLPAHTITGVTALSCDAESPISGSITVDVWADTYANFPPTSADKISASAPVTISSATKSRDTTLTGWTTSVAADSVYGFKVQSITSLKKVKIAIEATF